MVETSKRPLADLRVLDFSAWLPGPFCTQLLSDLGADVVKVEPPTGDPGRGDGGWAFDASNRDKRSIVLNLKESGDRERCLRLCAKADVVVEGFRPDVAARLGIAYDQVRRVRPDVIYCSISGFGQTGPDRLKPGHDLSYLAVSGALCRAPHWKEAPPQRSTVPIADLSAAFYGAIAILAALRQRDRTGEGAYLDVAIADATLSVAAPRAGLDLDKAIDRRRGVYPNNDIYRAADGAYVAVSAVEPKFWSNLREGLSQYEPRLGDARFDEESGRHTHGDELSNLLASAFSQRPAQFWVTLFREVDVPIDLIATIPQAIRSPQTQARSIVARQGGKTAVVFPVLKDGEVMGRFDSLPPPLGAHAADVEAEWLAAATDVPRRG